MRRHWSTGACCAERESERERERERERNLDSFFSDCFGLPPSVNIKLMLGNHIHLLAIGVMHTTY